MGASPSELAQYKDEGPIITNDRILRILKHVEDTNNVVLLSIIDKNGSEKGDGFLSDIIDVNVLATIKGEIKEYQWMIKSTPRDHNRWVMSRLWLGSDEREVKFFRDLLPQLKRFADSKNKSNLIPSFCPVTYAEWSDMDKVLVMQNLKRNGYSHAIDKKAGLDINHATLGIRWLASFHALSYAFIEQFEGGIENMKTGDLGINIDIPNVDAVFGKFQQFTGWNNENQLDLMKQIDKMTNNGTGNTYYHDKYRKKLHKLNSTSDVTGELSNSYDTCRFKIKTFNHGDAWFNNMLFKYGDDKVVPIDVKFIDLQMVAYRPAALDLTRFIFSSTTGKIRKSLSQLLMLYHDELITTVNQLGSLFPYTYDDLIDDFNNASFDGLLFAMGPLGEILQDKENLFDMDDFSKELGDRDITSDEVKAEIKKTMEEKRHGNKKSTAHLKRIKDIIDDFVAMDLM